MRIKVILEEILSRRRIGYKLAFEILLVGFLFQIRDINYPSVDSQSLRVHLKAAVANLLFRAPGLFQPSLVPVGPSGGESKCGSSCVNPPACCEVETMLSYPLYGRSLSTNTMVEIVQEMDGIQQPIIYRRCRSVGSRPSTSVRGSIRLSFAFFYIFSFFFARARVCAVTQNVADQRGTW